MKCYKCDCGVSAGKAMFPIDPKGPNRRWVCAACATADQVADIPQDVKEISYTVCCDERIKPVEAGEESQ